MIKTYDRPILWAMRWAALLYAIVQGYQGEFQSAYRWINYVMFLEVIWEINKVGHWLKSRDAAKSEGASA